MAYTVDAIGHDYSGMPAVADSAARQRSSRRSAPWLLTGILAVALFFHLWGIQRDLPYITDDATWVVNPAIRIAATGDLNPHVFGNPGSTLIYPLSAAYHIWNAAAHDGRWFHFDAGLRTLPQPGSGDARLSRFHLLGRLFTVLYALLSILLVYRIGRETIGRQAALLGALFAALYPSEMFDKRVRPDSASLFFGLLTLWFCVRLFRRPTIANQLLAGVAIGLAIGTKYYLGTLVAVLLVVDAMILWQHDSAAGNRRATYLGIVAGLGAVALGFALCTPYFFLDLATAMRDLKEQMRTSHIGADGLSPIGNLLWYLTVLPASLSWPQTAAAVVGIALAIWKHRFEQILLLVFAVTFLLGISSSALHWERWLIPVLPVFALFAAHGLLTTVAQLTGRFGLRHLVQSLSLVALIGICCLPSVQRLVQMDRLYSNPSTSVLARQWMTENLPKGSSIAFEWETLPPPLKADTTNPGFWVNRDAGRNLSELSMSRLAVRGTINWYAQRAFRYLVTSDLFYAYYPEHADRYPQEAAFYRELLTQGRLIYQVSPSAEHTGPEIRIYEIR